MSTVDGEVYAALWGDIQIYRRLPGINEKRKRKPGRARPHQSAVQPSTQFNRESFDLGLGKPTDISYISVGFAQVLPQRIRQQTTSRTYEISDQTQRPCRVPPLHTLPLSLFSLVPLAALTLALGRQQQYTASPGKRILALEASGYSESCQKFVFLRLLVPRASLPLISLNMATHHIATMLSPAWGHTVSNISVSIQILQKDPTLVITIVQHNSAVAQMEAELKTWTFNSARLRIIKVSLAQLPEGWRETLPDLVQGSEAWFKSPAIHVR
ncbi:hypothetical protein C8R44DRAFT_749772 [Mycena epipterygia]|nr:hypothetical protein C8R44DRAFT_749772 [Mycena epipterygia]